MADRPSGNKKRRRGRSHDGKASSSKTRCDESSRPSTLENGVKAKDSKNHNTLLLQLSDDEPTWYQYGQSLPGRNATLSTESNERNRLSKDCTSKSDGPIKQDPAVVNKYRALGDGIYKREVQLVSKATGKTADDRWVEATMHQGTLKDRIAAMSVLVSNEPVHKLYALDGLLQLAGCNLASNGNANPNSKPNSRVAQLAAQAMEDLFRNNLLPANRKLVTLDQRPLHEYEKTSGKTLSPRILLLWRFEEIVREKYHLFVRQYIAKALRDGMELDKKFALRCACALLKSVPEGEAQLLQLIVNKLGDPSKKVAASAAHALRQVLQEHSAMKVVVAREVQQLAHRPNLSARALYNCATFLNQLPLDKQSELAGSLMTTYFRLFDVIVGEKAKSLEDGELLKSRLLSALLTGVNRAHPFLPERDQDLEAHMDVLYRVVHTATYSARTQALLLLFHVTVGTHISDKEDQADVAGTKWAKGGVGEVVAKRQDRFYRALYSTLADPLMLGSGKHMTMFFNLLYKALKHDQVTDRVLGFVKRILATSLHCSSPVLAASIVLVKEIAKYHPVILSCFQDVLQGSNAVRVLDPSKREPRGALTPFQDAAARGSGSSNKSVHVNAGVKAALWELSLSKHHYHPSVTKFSESLGNDADIHYTGDPLRDFGLVPFLDKFAYRNPKSNERTAAKPKGAGAVGHRRNAAESTSYSSTPVNDPEFLDHEQFQPQDEFFRLFFLERARRDDLRGIVRRKPRANEEDEAWDKHQTEQDALDEEEAWDGSKRFEDWEREWKSDPEEEAFVDSIAQTLLEDYSGQNGPSELDDEDPDTGDWDDMYSDDIEMNVSLVDTEVANPSVAAKEKDDDDFLDGASSGSSDEDEEEVHLEGEESVTSFAGKHEMDSESHTSSDNEYTRLAESDDSDAIDGDDDHHHDPVSKDQHEWTKHKSKQKVAGTFAAFDEYEERINESWHSLHYSKENDDEAEHQSDYKIDAGRALLPGKGKQGQRRIKKQR